MANKLVDEHSVKNVNKYEQLDLFTDYEDLKKQREKENAESEREKRMQNTILDIKKKFGKNAILKRNESSRRCNCQRPQQSNRRSQGIIFKENYHMETSVINMMT